MTEWVEVTIARKAAPPVPEEKEESEDPPKHLTKQQLKNRKRSERRKERSNKAPTEPRHRRRRRQEDSKDRDKSSESESESQEEVETLGELERRSRRLSKMLKQIEAAESKVEKGLHDAQVITKIKRREAVERELATVRRDLAAIEDRRQAKLAARHAASAARARDRDSDALLILSVKFDERFACPICTEVVEAAVSVPRACAHVFCRACLEDHVAKAARPDDCACPMCRSKLCDPQGRVDARPHAASRARLKYLTGYCHCGDSLPLNKLRDHLRHCGPKAHLFAPRRKFGHEFKQPSFSSSSSSSRRGGDARLDTTDERLQLQAALLASVHDR
ncbi:hypothetical protein CTAYLR_000986 [Chrysophaeum taylorii]|uniref:RING-type domain-containing protein n=1 Tax=Chrysophaeum taylorii TaxID=2483200 RepID=A0AAD7UFF1_9STRA|nr:hypothetical protein CTAYLR_000986 [Chrysophaeum taylorii]